MTRRGVQDAVPLFIPAIPFAFVLGVAILDSGMNELVGWSSSSIVYAGAAQLTLVTLLGGGAAWLAAVTAALVVNSRHALYSLALAPAFQRQPAWFRWVGSALLIDQVFVLAEARKDDPSADFRRYYLSSALFFVVAWNLCVALGLLVGPAVPTEWGLAFAIPVMFTGMLIGGLNAPPKVAAAAVAAAVTALAAGMPNRTGLLVGAAAGVAAGMAVARVRR
jgi:predicted branched-subunit amino acid permease